MKKEALILKHDSITSLPVLYQTFCELIKLSQQKEPDLNKLKTLLFEDVGLCVKALNDINSVEYREEPLKTFSQGLEELALERFLIKGFGSPFYKQNSAETVWHNRFNQRSVVTALACRFMGEKIGYPDLEELYLCGLLHNMGILLLKSSFPEEYELVLERTNNGDKLSQVEKEILATDHLEAGQRAVENWDFPRNLKKAFEADEPDREKDYEPSELVSRIVGVAEQVAEVVFVETGSQEIENLAETWEKSINLPSGFFSQVFPKLSEEMNQRSGYYRKVPDDLTDMLMQAHNQITILCQACDNKLYEKFRELTRKDEENRKKEELESLKIILATFSHYINNATTSIMGRSQLLDIAIKRGEIKDESGKISSSMKVIQNGVENITAVLNGLKKLDSFRTTRYHDHSNIIDLRDKIEIKEL
jgi:HD-like signal output (HDOD) protein